MSHNISAQAVRYALSGAAAAAAYLGVYWLLGVELAIWPLLANACAWLSSLVTSYILHSRWTFGGSRERGFDHRRSVAGFLLVNLGGLLLNSLWVWLIVEALGLDVRLPLVPILGVTPWLMFLAMRRWAFT